MNSCCDDWHWYFFEWLLIFFLGFVLALYIIRLIFLMKEISFCSRESNSSLRVCYVPESEWTICASLKQPSLFAQFKHELQQLIFKRVQNWGWFKTYTFAFSFLFACFLIMSLFQVKNCLWWRFAALQDELMLWWLTLIFLWMTSHVLSWLCSCLRILFF